MPLLPEIEEDSGLRGKLVVQGGEHVGVDEAGIAYIAFERLLIGFLPDFAQLFARNPDIPSYP